MPSTFGQALSEELRLSSLVGLAAFAVLLRVAFGVEIGTVALMIGAGMLTAVMSALTETSSVSRRTVQAVFGGLLLVFGVGTFLTAPDPIASWWFGALALFAGGWVTLDAVTAKRAGIESADHFEAEPDAAEMMATMGLVRQVFETLEAADGPQSVDDVASACGLTHERADSLLSMLSSRDMVERREYGYVANEAYVGRLSSARTLSERLFARLSRPFRLLAA